MQKTVKLIDTEDHRGAIRNGLDLELGGWDPQLWVGESIPAPKLQAWIHDDIQLQVPVLDHRPLGSRSLFLLS